MSNKIFLTALTASTALLAGNTTLAGVWDGDTNSDYDTATNWVGDTLPDVNNGDLVIDNGDAVTSTGNVFLGAVGIFDSAAPGNASLTVTNGSSLAIGNELILTSFDQSTASQGSANVFIGAGSSVTAANLIYFNVQSADDTAGPNNPPYGNDVGIHLTGVGASVTHSNNAFGQSLRARVNWGDIFETNDWEEMWDRGLLTVAGQSGQTGATFGNFVALSNNDTTATALVPEPSSLGLLGLGGLLIARRRRG